MNILITGGDVPVVVTDATTPTPQGSYGIQKLIGELLVQDDTRKGFIDGRSVHIPTVVCTLPRSWSGLGGTVRYIACPRDGC